MANKLFLVSATLAFFFLLTNASIYRTIVEVDEDGATNISGPRCRKEFQQAQHLRSCQQWIHKQARQSGGSGPYWTLDGEFDFEDDIENPQGGGQQQRPPLLQQCCNELQQEEPQCVCPTLKRASQAVRQQIQQQGGQQGHGQGQQGQGQQQMVSRIFQTAKNLPRVCNIRQVGVCPFQQSMPGPYY